MDTPLTHAVEQLVNTEQLTDLGPASERFLLGMIGGLCNQMPRDEAMLGVLIEQLQRIQGCRSRTLIPLRA